MSVTSLILILAVVVVVIWLADTDVPMDRKMNQALNVGVTIILVLWLLSAYDILNPASTLSNLRTG